VDFLKKNEKKALQERKHQNLATFAAKPLKEGLGAVGFRAAHTVGLPPVRNTAFFPNFKIGEV